MSKIKPDRRSEPPKWIGRYQILSEAGRGATAFVYKAYDPQLDRHLAIKVLRQELANDNDYREAFIREARLAAHLSHPGIVTIYDVGIANDKPYIAMELLEGFSLDEILQSQGKLNLHSMLSMSMQLSEALSYAHQQGVIHRDIKPGNIIVLNDNKTVEQILGKPVDNRSDIYSLGVLIYQLLSGQPPFVNTDLGLLFKQIIKDKPPILMLKYAIEEEKIKDDLTDFIRKLLQKNPSSNSIAI